MSGLSTKTIYEAYTKVVATLWMYIIGNVGEVYQERRRRQAWIFNKKFHERLTELEEKAQRYDMLQKGDTR